MGFLIIGLSSFQDAYAVPNCSSAGLEANTMYVSTQLSQLYKVDVTNGDNCLIGVIKTDATQNPGTVLDCKDIAIDHTNGLLYCLADGFTLRIIDRTANFNAAGANVGPGAEFIDSTFVNVLTDITNNQGFNNANSLEIDSAGRAYLAGSGGNEVGKFYTLNLITGDATQRVDFGAARASSGDLARDESTTNHLYITIQCDNLIGAEACDPSKDRLFRILLNTPGCIGPCPDTIIPLAVLSQGDMFAMDIAQPSLNLCFVSLSGFLVETDREGVQIKSVLLDGSIIEAFGASANNIGGTMLMINTMSLLIAAGQSNPMWLILLTISGVAVVAYQFKDKIKSKNKKINE